MKIKRTIVVRTSFSMCANKLMSMSGPNKLIASIVKMKYELKQNVRPSPTLVMTFWILPSYISVAIGNKFYMNPYTVIITLTESI